MRSLRGRDGSAMTGRENTRIAFRKRYSVLLVLSAILGIIATLRALGVDKLTVPAAALLVAASILALVPLILLFGGDGIRRWRRRAIIAVIFAAHLVGVLFFFPPEDLVNNRPVLTLDHAIHFYQVERAKEIFHDSHRLNGYDPFFMAGYPGGTIFDLDTKGVEIWCSILAFVDTARAYKLFIILGHLLLVFTIYGGCRRLKYDFEEAAFALLVFLPYWHWGRPYAGDYRFAGMFAFLFVSHLSLYITGLFGSFLRGEAVKRFYILGPLAFLTHPTAVVILPVGFLAAFLIERRLVPDGNVRKKWEIGILARMILWCLVVVAVNAVWLVPFFRYLDIKSPSETFFQVSGAGGLLRLIIKPGNLPVLLLIALAAAGLGALVRKRRFEAAVPPAAVGLFLMLIAGFGIYLPIFNQMEPGRFLLTSFVFMAPLSGAGLAALIRGGKKVFSSSRLFQPAKAAALVVLLLATPVLALLSSRSYYRHTLSTTFVPEVKELIGALDDRLTRDGRLMIEDGPAWIYGDCFLPSILPLYTGIEQVGGPYPFSFITHNFTNCFNGRIMGKPVASLGHNAMKDYLDLYNIHWIVTATVECKDYFSLFPGVDPVWDSEHFTLWQVSSPSTFTSFPGTKTDASYDRIDLRLETEDAEAVPDRILLKYHWDRGLRVEPPARISPVKCLDDPVPMILLEPMGKMEIGIFYK